MAVVRTQYWNLSTGTVRGGATGHGESLTDVESYLLPVDRLRTAALHGFGVADGLRVRATTGAAGIGVSNGTAVDAAGRVIALVDQGVAVTDPSADPDAVQNVATVPVGPDGVTLDTTLGGTPSGDLLLTLTWREVAGTGAVANAPVLLHAPWVRLVPAAGFVDTGQQVVLAAARLDAAGLVTALAATPRRAATAEAGTLALRAPATGTDPADPARAVVDDLPAAAVVGQAGGGLRVDLLGGTPRTALSVDAAGNLAVGVDLALRTLHVEGGEVHSGGPGGGFSFADRTAAAFTESPTAGERWVWYASGGEARLWSGADRLAVGAAGDGGGLDVPRRMRVRQGGDSSAGLWLHQSGPDADRAFVGMAGDDTVGLYGVGCGWGLTMDVGTGRTTVGNGLVAKGVVVGTDAAGLIDYPWEYETVGVARPEYNLRLQSPNSVIVHAGGAERAYFSGAGLALQGNLYLRGRMTLEADDEWLRLNQFGQYANGVHTPWALSCGNLNVGGVNSWASPGQGNLSVAGSLVVNGVVRLGVGDLPVYIGGNQTGAFLRLHDDMWLADRQTGMIDVLDGQATGWGTFRGHFREPSSREHKRAITPLAVAEQEALLAEALAAELVWFRWRDDDDGGRPRLGVIAEDAPEHLVEEDRTGLSMPEYLAVLLGAVQALHRRIAELPAGSAA